MRGHPPHARVFPSLTATAAGRGSEQEMLCAGQQDQAMGPGSGSPEMAARRNLAPRPPRPPLPRGSPALRAGPPRPPACSIQPTKQPQVPAPREVKHPLVWGYVGWHNPGRGWGRSPGSRMQAAALPLVGAGCVCTRGCVRVCTPAPWRPGRGVCHHNLGPPSGPCRG